MEFLGHVFGRSEEIGVCLTIGRVIWPASVMVAERVEMFGGIVLDGFRSQVGGKGGSREHRERSDTVAGGQMSCGVQTSNGG